MEKQKVALITGVTGQDGAYLAEFLLNKGYVVHGIKRRASSFNTDRIDHLLFDSHEIDVKFFLHYGDMTDSMNLTKIIQETQPDEIYNLAAMSHVHVSFATPEYVANQLPNCSVRFRKLRKKKQLLFIREARMRWRNYMHTGLRKIIVKLIICSHATEYCSIMKALFAVKLL